MGSLRLLLALSVALSHFGGPLTIFHSRYAVQVFYVISGFLIQMILTEKYQGKSWLFYSNRAIRIFVPYWAVLIPTAVLCAWNNVGFVAALRAVADSFGFPTIIYVAMTNLFIFGQDVGLFLGWSAETQLYFTGKFSESSTAVWSLQAVPQAWTVSLELWFYLLAPFLLRSNVPTLILVLGLSFGMRIFGYQAGLIGDPWNYRFLPFELSWFLLGALAYRASGVSALQRLLGTFPQSIATLTFLGVLLLITGYGRVSWITRFVGSTSGFGQPIGLFLVTAAALPALFRFSARHKWDRRVGDLSYPIYIVHYSVIWALGVWPIFPELGKWRHVLITVALSAAIAILIESPLDRWRQRRTNRAAASLGSLSVRTAGVS